MADLYQQDLAYIQAKGFGDFARGAAPEIVRMLRATPVPVQRVVEVGCGAGPLTALLVDAGFDVTAIDLSPELVRIARTVCPAANFQLGSIYTAEIPASDAIVAIGEPLTYHDEPDADSRVRGFIRRASNALPRHAPLIFDLIEVGEPTLAGRSWRAGEDWAVLVETIEDQTSRTLVRNIETFRKVGNGYRRGHELHRVRLFDTREVSAWLGESGFRVNTATSYGQFELPPRRQAFLAVRG